MRYDKTKGLVDTIFNYASEHNLDAYSFLVVLGAALETVLKSLTEQEFIYYKTKFITELLELSFYDKDDTSI